MRYLIPNQVIPMNCHRCFARVHLFKAIFGSFFLPSVLSLVVGPATLCAQPSAAANPTPTPDQGDILPLDKLVVTGSVTPQSKLKPALAVTTLDHTVIETAAPRSTAEILK